jgi:sugar/nucleoside kinase (ribokinase family)
MDFVTFGIIIDDVMRADGMSLSGLLGGGGPQTAFGMRLWADVVGLVARVGADLPAQAWQWLRASEIDTQGVQVTGWPTLRAAQRLDTAGRRIHVWQVPDDVVQAQLRRSVPEIPMAYRAARGWHLGLHPEAPGLDFLAALRGLGGQVSMETFRPAERRLSPQALTALVSAADVFSPNRLSAESLVGPGEPEALARRLIDAGANVVALRMGALGSLVVEAQSRRAVRVPALPVEVVDAVGAGNAYCGAFLTGWADTGDILEAGLRGAAAASFVVEQFGVPEVSAPVHHAARERLKRLQPLAERFRLV